jgi:hypothetical protein
MTMVRGAARRRGAAAAERQKIGKRISNQMMMRNGTVAISMTSARHRPTNR